ncbi:RNA 2',3'-cyclic phosphodiesterase [Streptomonospora sp. S1-112]|uniref:RNA 2',3'-cyclic phosphodiesterase n=1 Tax=Streptomonospora mangrovi TaxID=2883123 RepID=A0A9X3SH31_9ACTN|nr:RNA 2',3'-cyclic phosphodiesterase [Streptomonospora mangrovi]MDA0566640.1 RNA 2',3'-cyclic phosphodiesterase [Streptomonospora mangrovi]
MRLFAAVQPPDGVLDEVALAVEALAPPEPGAADRAAAPADARAADITGGGFAPAGGHVPPGLRWSSPDEWHVTLVFLGEVADDAVPGVAERLAAEAARHAPFQVAVRGAGTFPGDPAQASVLWAGLEGDVDELTLLADGLRRAARKAGVRVDRRPYAPHLTLARVRPPGDVSALRYTLGRLATAFWTVEEVRLMRSHHPRRPRYETLQTWRLG